MGLFFKPERAANAASFLASDMSMVKSGRNAIFNMRDRLRNTPQFSDFFYKIINDVTHPPRIIEATQTGEFWSEAWIASYNNYEPYSTQKITDRNIGYIEGCAMYLLIQDCYPDIYDFPGNTVQQLNNGATIKLIMKKKYIGQPLQPAFLPPKVAPVMQSVQQTPVNTAGRFCTNCGNKNDDSSKFCCKCGTPLK